MYLICIYILFEHFGDIQNEIQLTRFSWISKFKKLISKKTAKCVFCPTQTYIKETVGYRFPRSRYHNLGVARGAVVVVSLQQYSTSAVYNREDPHAAGAAFNDSAGRISRCWNIKQQESATLSLYPSVSSLSLSLSRNVSPLVVSLTLAPPPPPPWHPVAPPRRFHTRRRSHSGRFINISLCSLFLYNIAV